MAHRRRTARTSCFTCALLAALALAPLSLPASAASGRIVTVVFRGLYPDPPGTAGMDHLAASLSTARPEDSSRPFSVRVFAYPEIEQAVSFVNGFSDRGCLILIGHSLGGNAAIRLANRLMVDIDLLIQLDSVGGAALRRPNAVKRGVNYYQQPSRIFEWPRGRTSVTGLTDFPVEDRFQVGRHIITHTTIDDPFFGFTDAHYQANFPSEPDDLYARIGDQVDAACPQ